MNIGEIRYTVYRIRVSDFSIINADANFERITGYPIAEFYDKGLKYTELIPKTDIVEYLVRFAPVFKQPGSLYYEHRLIKKNGDAIVVFSLMKSYVNRTNGELEAEIILTDVTETTMLPAFGAEEQQYVSLTEHDALTGLYNRGLFERKVDEYLLHGEKDLCAMLLVEIDNLKAINEIFSHQAGDLALNIVATTLLMLYRNSCVISRIGGDQFCIYIPHLRSKEQLTEYIFTVQNKINNINIPEYNGVNIDSVIGAAMVVKEDLTFSRLYRNAELSLEHAKLDKSNGYNIYDDSEASVMFSQKKSQILLIVTPDRKRVDVIKEIFGSQYHIKNVLTGDQALKLIDQDNNKIAMVLSDIYAQGIDGFVVLDYMRRMDYIKRIPIIFWSRQYNEDIYKNAFSHGVIDIISEPYDYYSMSSRLNNTIELYQHKNHLEEMTRRQTMKIEKLNASIIDSLGTVVEFRDLESGDHIKRVKTFTQIIADEVMKDCPEYELTQWKIKMIAEASPLHDVGKIAISDTILLKPGKLTKEEFEIMKTHTTRGYEIVDQIFSDNDEEYKIYCSAIAKYHHEKYDGRGYPEGLAGDDIPICAQIVSIADVYDALVSKRCYKDAYSLTEAYDMIMNGECGVFNPKLLKCFTKVKAQLEKQADLLCC